MEGREGTLVSPVQVATALAIALNACGTLKWEMFTVYFLTKMDMESRLCAH